MSDIDSFANDLREVLAHSSQTRPAATLSSEQFDPIDRILSDAGTPLRKSKKTASELEAWHLLTDCAIRVAWGQVLTGTHREYLLAVLGQLLDPKVKTAREARTFSKARGKVAGMIRTENGWRNDPEYIDDENIALAIRSRMDGRRMGLPPCSHSEAIAWAADTLHKDERQIARREAAYWKAWGIKPRSKGRPRKMTK